jgi:predicted alpha/beta-hydrolase family hydrolase
VLFAHGAGTPADHPFMARMASGLAERGLQVVRFEFPFMAARRTGVRRPPERLPRLVDAMVAAAAALPRGPAGLCLLGKSMGARVACRAAEATGALRVACLGFPVHPPRHPERSRLEDLAACPVPTLVVQGERDPFGTRAEVEALLLPPTASAHWVPHADHDLVVPMRHRDRSRDLLDEVAGTVAGFFRDGQHPPAAVPMLP